MGGEIHEPDARENLQLHHPLRDLRPQIDLNQWTRRAVGECFLPISPHHIAQSLLVLGSTGRDFFGRRNRTVIAIRLLSIAPDWRRRQPFAHHLIIVGEVLPETVDILLGRRSNKTMAGAIEAIQAHLGRSTDTLQRGVDHVEARDHLIDTAKPRAMKQIREAISLEVRPVRS